MNNRFFSYLQNRLEYVNCGVPRISNLRPPLFLICINDLNCAMRYPSAHHFAGDTNLLNCNNSVKRMNKLTKT